jgi:AcrR family transcriptional regulator
LVTPIGKCENTCFLILVRDEGCVKIDVVAQVRPYRGVDAAERLAQRRSRLLAAGVDLLGGNEQDPADLTVRAICRQAGLGVRYFYESFSDKDAFVGAVFDSVIAEIAATTQAAVTAAPPKEQARAGMANIVATIVGDARVGRLLFSMQLSNAVIMRKRAESIALFAMLTGQHAGTLGVQANDRIKAASHFVVGGVTQTISAWLAGDVDLDPDQLVDQLASIIDALADPRLYMG